VGTFNIASELSAGAAAAGDPLTLRMRVTGSGNFDRVDSAMLEHVDQWKTYPPKSSFSAADALGYKGEKTFEQPVVALKSGPQTLPELAFSYFDPTTRSYETARSRSLNVVISPSVADGPAVAPGLAVSGGGLRADHATGGTPKQTLAPLYFQPGFLALPSLLSVVFVGGWIAQRRGASAPNAPLSARSRRVSKAAKRALARLKAAEDSGDAVLFLNHARSALREARAVDGQGSSDQLTTAEAVAWFGSDADDVRQLFALADEVKYSDRPLGAVDFARWTRIVRQQLTAGKPI